VPWKGKRANGVGRLKVGYTSQKTAEERVAEIHGVKGPEGIRWTIVVDELAQRDDGQYFNDHAVHDYLENKMGIHHLDGEWFECTKEEVLAAIRAVRKDPTQPPPPPNNYKMRPEQEEAVRATAEYFAKVAREQKSAASNRAPHFLWNAKMRFGKTFTTYQLAKQQKWKRILVLTFKPAVEGEWRNQLEQHVDFKGWQFRGGGEELGRYLEKDPLVWFVSFQDIGGKNKSGLTKERLKSLYGIEWDCVRWACCRNARSVQYAIMMPCRRTNGSLEEAGRNPVGSLPYACRKFNQSLGEARMQPGRGPEYARRNI
jgi:hypothetical protein